MSHQKRQLAAILFTDIVGYTAMMQKDEHHAVVIMKRYTEVMKQLIARHEGVILNDYGDGSLCTFSSATQAMYCAVDIQQEFQNDPKVPLRIGFHVGEIFFEGDKVMGDGVNVASRIQSLGLANSILFSREVFDKIKNQSEFKTSCLGMFEFKNVDEGMEVFALGNKGLKVPRREEMSGKVSGQKKKSVRNKWFVIASVIVLLGIAFFAYRMARTTGFTGNEKTVAVLPFDNIGSDTSEEYISDGITQDIINNLSKITSLQKVIGWISVKGFKKNPKPMKEIAEELDVAAILSGTVQKQGTKTRIIAELIEVATAKRLWGGEYEYSGSDLLSIQSEVALQIVNTLKASLSPEERKGISKNYTENVEAYKYYRKGRYFWDLRTIASYDSAEFYYNKSILSDPDYALAYAGLADCYTFNQKGLSQNEAIPIARDYANKALSLDPTLIEAKTTIAFIQSHYGFDWKGSFALFKQIIKEDPNYPDAHLYYGNILVATGETDEGLKENKKALSLDPLSPRNNFVLGRNYYYSHRYDSSIVQLQKTHTRAPKFINIYVPLGLSYIQKKMYQNAIDAFTKLPPKPYDQGNNGILFLAYAYMVSGDKIKAMNLFEKISSEDRRKCAYLTGVVYTAFGDFDSARTYLNYAYADHSLWMPTLKNDPTLDPVRNEQWFKELMKKMNFE
ncbi:MAG TPA: tetratricopeptide repeat protein [Puia sp.]|nr:tetratricopeptide repeat protein [Puia sp.]